MVMTRITSPGVDPNWGYPQGGFTTWYPQGGFTTWGGAPPGMEGRPLKQKEQLGQQMPGAPRQQGSSSGAVTTGFGLKNSPLIPYNNVAYVLPLERSPKITL